MTLPTSLISKILFSLSPLTHSRYYFDNCSTSSGAVVYLTNLSLISFHLIYPFPGVTLSAKRDLFSDFGAKFSS